VKEKVEMQADAIATLLVGLNGAIKKTLSEEPIKTLASAEKADCVFRSTIHLLGQQIALGVVQSPAEEIDLNAVVSAVATKIKAATETYITIMRKEKNAKADDKRH
jgi:hypothetical protein